MAKGYRGLNLYPTKPTALVLPCKDGSFYVRVVDTDRDEHALVGEYACSTVTALNKLMRQLYGVPKDQT